MVKPEFKEALDPIVRSLLTEGGITVKSLRGSPELKELRRLFGTNLGVAHSNKGKTRLRLLQRDPDKMYFALSGAKTVIPEELTNARITKDPTQLDMSDIQFMNRLERVEIPREVRE